jgi:ubiquinone/menaquinone biosynthesis C-methylase UbiE
MRSKEETRRTYNKMSQYYDIFGGFERKYRFIGLKILDPHPDDTLLELGFGTGSSIIWMSRIVGSTGKVYGIDISEKMLQIAQRKVRKYKMEQNVILSQGDACNTHFESGKFDGIFMSFTIELFSTDEISQILVECRRILKPNGKLAIVALSKVGRFQKMTRLYEKLHEKYPQTLDCRPINLADIIKANNFKLETQKIVPMWGLYTEIVLGKS